MSGSDTSLPLTRTCAMPSARTMRSSASTASWHVRFVNVVDPALEPRLRPAAHVVAPGLLALHFVDRLDGAGGEHEDARTVRVADERRVSRIARVQTGERVEMRAIADEQQVLFDRSGHLYRFENAGPGTGEDRRAVRRRLELGGEPLLNTVEVPRQARPRVCIIYVRRGSFSELGPDELLVAVAAAVVRLGVQIQADEWKTCRPDVGKPVEEGRELGGSHALVCSRGVPCSESRI